MDLQPDYLSYTDSELEEAYNSVDKDSFPERAELLKAEIDSRRDLPNGSLDDELQEYTWKSDGRNGFFALFFLLMAIITCFEALNGDILSILGFSVSVIFMIFYLRILHKKSGWVTLNEEGVVYEDLSGVRKIKWFEISGCRIQHMNYTKYASLKLSNGNSELLPVFGKKAEEIKRIIVEKLAQENST